MQLENKTPREVSQGEKGLLDWLLWILVDEHSIQKHPGWALIWDNYSNEEISFRVKKVWLWEVSDLWSGQWVSQTETKQLYYISIYTQGASLRFLLRTLRWSFGLYLPSGNRASCSAFPNRKFGLGPGSFRKTATDWCFKRTNVAARTAAAKNSDETAAAARIILEEVMEKLP